MFMFCCSVAAASFSTQPGVFWLHKYLLLREGGIWIILVQCIKKCLASTHPFLNLPKKMQHNYNLLRWSCSASMKRRSEIGNESGTRKRNFYSNLGVEIWLKQICFRWHNVNQQFMLQNFSFIIL